MCMSTVFARTFPKKSMKLLAVTCQPSYSSVASVGPKLKWLWSSSIKLRNQWVKQLEEELKSLITKISQISDQSNTLHVSSIVSQNDKLAVAVESKSKPSAPIPSPLITRGFFLVSANNLVIYGIAECPKATPRTTKVWLSKLSITVVFKVNADINSFLECLCLSNYNNRKSSHAHPILLK